MRAPANIFRLVFVSVALPAVFVALDDAALRYGSAHNWSPATGVTVCSLFVVQTALLSYLAGAQLTNWGWRLLLLGWSLVLVNLLLATGATVDSWDQRLLSLAFLSAEFGTLVAWLTLGSESFLRRLGLVVLAGVPVAYLSDVLDVDSAGLRWGDPWVIIVAVQIGGTSGLVALLRLAGYRIEHACHGATERLNAPIQFSIRHLLIATTIVAVVVPTVQSLMKSTSRWMGGRQWLHASTDGIVLALVSLAALWMALGSGRWALKVLTFALLAILAGGGLYWLEATVLYPQPYARVPTPLTYAGWRWIAWTLLTGTFLAGMLLVLRGTDHRLIRRRR
jgi:hypothetical protein